MRISRNPFGEVGGHPVDLFQLENDNGVKARITNYGGIVTSLVVPDRRQVATDVICGFDSLAGYLSTAYKANSPNFGGLIGRYAVPIDGGESSLGDRGTEVATNEGTDRLRAGVISFDQQVWDVTETIDECDAVGLKLGLTISGREKALPGNVEILVEYRLTNDDEFCIFYLYETERAIPISLTNHTCFNLNGFQNNVLDHTARILSDRYLPAGDTDNASREAAPVADTIHDLNQPQRIGDALQELPMGFEHYYVFSKPVGMLKKVAEVYDPASGRKLAVVSSEPGALFYTGGYISEELRRESGAQFGQFCAFCLETSKYPHRPTAEAVADRGLGPGSTYDETTIYKLSWG